MNDRTKGLLIMLTGVVLISPDALLVRFLSERGTPPGAIFFWKMLFSLPLSLGFAAYEQGGIRPLWQSVVEGRRHYAAAIPLQTCVEICFTLAFVYTSPANALLLINLNPLWCAVAGRFILGDLLPRRTYITLVLALGCMLLIFVPEIVEQQHGENENEAELGESSTKGNIIAFCCGLGLAMYITLVRHGSKAEKPVNLIGAAAISAALTSMIGLIIQGGDVLPTSFWEGELWQFWLAQIGEGMAIGIIFIVMTIAPRLITGAEVGLCGLLEAVLGPLFVYFGYGDVPSKWTIIGGSLLLVVLAIHESGPLFEKANYVRKSISHRLSTRISSGFVAAQAETEPKREDEESSPVEGTV
mmetsp:Transcript_22968/g.34836  ORF Transcript_22968/g.34836 Transcript_22968/m.34836 type:complete len:357 (-) Transcript_22968:293-1363(-)